MQNIFDEVGSLDQRCYEQFALSEDILMEHAANGMADFIKKNFSCDQSILILCGGGNNGADGLALSRILHKDYNLKVLLLKEPKSKMAKVQFERCQKVGVGFVEEIVASDIVVDAVFGTGFHGEISEKLAQILDTVNTLSSVKIACDIPSAYKFKADYTLTMGALKKSLFEDEVKDYIGEISVLDLGVSRSIYEKDADVKLLEESDLQLPHRTMQNTHKGTYGHLAVVSGEKTGASIMSAKAAFRFGSALVTLLSNENINAPYEIMQSHQLPSTTSAVALGMGLGVEFSQGELERFVSNPHPLLLDADIFYHPLFCTLLERDNVVITPHPKEFCEVLKQCGITEISVDELQQNRFKYVEMFSRKFSNVTLVLKGANVIISHGSQIFVNPYGSNILAKGGSGDILAGLISGLLAQGYMPVDAAISGSLAHTKLAKSYRGADFSLTPSDLIDGICKL